MLNVYRKTRLHLRRFLSATGFASAVALFLSVPSFAVYYNIGMFWKGTGGPAGPTFTERKIARRSSYGCAVISDGTAKCWGYNVAGKLGDGTSTNRTTPVAVTGLSNVISVDQGGYNSCAVLSDGTAKCWGYNAYGHLGNGTTTDSATPVTVSGLTSAIFIISGKHHNCAVLSDGTAKCWGYNANGQLGDGTSTNRTTPVAVSGLSGVVSIDPGDLHTCAILSDGTAKCWGSNGSGQLGDGTTTARTTPVTVTGLSGVVSINTGLGGGGGAHSCAILSNGTMKCWGSNTDGQLGDGTTTNSTTPVTVTGLSDAVSITGGYYHSCAVLSDGTAKCWGAGSYGQLGNGATTASILPVVVTGLSGAVSINGKGGYGNCASLSDGAIKCWGRADFGQLGNGSTANSSTPVAVSGFANTGPYLTFTDVAAIFAGDDHACALLTRGTVKCWGDNLSGQLGDGTTTDRSTPVTVSGLSGVVDMPAGGSHSCAVLSDGTAKCWGRNLDGQLGDGTTTNSSTPVVVSGLSGVVEVVTGTNHSCAVLFDGTAKCWGMNTFGGLGDGTTTSRSIPVTVSGLSGVVRIEAGGSYSCAALSDGSAKCWGYNGYGRLGDGTITSRSTPVTVTGLSGVVRIEAGGGHSCAVLSNGTAKCWGGNYYGQLGDGTTTDRSTPVTVTGLSGVVEMGRGGFHGCALLTGGIVKCWGDNMDGKLGDGTTTNRSTPVTVSGLSGVVSIAAGDGHTCAALSDGTAKCWGDNNLDGQLGAGTKADSFFPVDVSLFLNIYTVGASTAENGSGAGTLVITKPSGTDIDHVMVAGITTRPSTTTITPPSGWTLLQSQATGNITQSIYYRVATSADAGLSNYTWTLSVSAKASGVIAAYGNVDPTSPIVISDGLATAASTVITAPTLTTSESRFQSVTFYGIASDGAITGPSGYTSVGEISSSGGGAGTTKVRTLMSHKRYTTSGATGAITATGPSIDNVGQHVLLKVAP